MSEANSVFQEEEATQKKPQFSVKIAGVEGYAGSGWLREGQYGKSISVITSCDIPRGSRLYINPTKSAGAILG
ncbi:MAG: hypothetical protein ACP5O3_01500 [Candidatus Micrarchaeia archaeon]